VYQNRFETVLELGSELASRLQAGREASDDLLASWMAHHVAELIDAAEKATGDARGAAAATCEQAILDLWKYRETLPRHVRPMVELEPVLRTLASLDSGAGNHRYYPAGLSGVTEACDADAREWLEFAMDIDEVARLLIADALRVAAQRAVSRAEPWVQLAKRVGAPLSVEAAFVDFARADRAHAADECSAEERRALSGLAARMRGKSKTKDAPERSLGPDDDGHAVELDEDEDWGDEADEADEADEPDEVDAVGQTDQTDLAEESSKSNRVRAEAEERLLASALAKLGRKATRGRLLVVERLLVAANALADSYRAQLKASEEGPPTPRETSAQGGMGEDVLESPVRASVDVAAREPDGPNDGQAGKQS